MQYSCNLFYNKLKNNWFNKSLFFLFLIAAALIAVGILLAGHSPSDGKKYFGLLIG